MIGTLRESSLHASLKELYARPGDRARVRARRLRRRSRARRTSSSSSRPATSAGMRAKLEALLEGHRVRVVHPVAVETMILRIDERRRRALAAAVAGARVPPLAVRRARVDAAAGDASRADVRGRARAGRGAPGGRAADAAAAEAVACRGSGARGGAGGAGVRRGRGAGAACCPLGSPIRSPRSISRLRSRCRGISRSGSRTRCEWQGFSTQSVADLAASPTDARPEALRTLATCHRSTILSGGFDG